jgi:small nuclear ribonucleoprotein (snRNP)-like protein
MSLLRSFFLRRLRVYVSIRRSHSIRGVLNAYLSAFDKHWNLLLLDVDEEYTEWEWRLCGVNTIDTLKQQGIKFQLPKQWKINQTDSAIKDDTTVADSSSVASAAIAASPAPSLPSYIRVEVWKQRHVNQLYVRGDGIVSVSQFPPTAHTLNIHM